MDRIVNILVARQENVLDLNFFYMDYSEAVKLYPPLKEHADIWVTTLENI